MVAESPGYGEAEWRGTLATALERVATMLAERGARDDALSAAQEAVAIQRELAAKAPDAYRPDLAMALNNLAIRLSEVGQRQEALGPPRRPSDLYRELAAKAPDAYRPDLASALNNLAIRLSAVGQRQEALGAGPGGRRPLPRAGGQGARCLSPRSRRCPQQPGRFA